MNLKDEIEKALLFTSKDDVAIKLSEAKRIAEEYAKEKTLAFGKHIAYNGFSLEEKDEMVEKAFNEWWGKNK